MDKKIGKRPNVKLYHKVLLLFNFSKMALTTCYVQGVRVKFYYQFLGISGSAIQKYFKQKFFSIWWATCSHILKSQEILFQSHLNFF